MLERIDMAQAQKKNGDWVEIEARTNGWYEGDNFVCDVCGTQLSEGYRQAILP